jgi:hypothetical protein
MWINDDHEQLQRSMSEPVPVKEKPKIRKVLSQVHDLLSSDEEDQDEEPPVQREEEKPTSLLKRFTSSALWPGSWATQPKEDKEPLPDVDDMMGVELVKEEPQDRRPRVASNDLLDDLFSLRVCSEIAISGWCSLLVISSL